MNEAVPRADRAGLQTLPITPLLGEIRASLARHAVTIVCGATGSGKSTRIPQLCLQEWPEARIGLTQPRRLPARTVAARIAQEQGSRLGTVVGFQTRFDQQVSRATRLKVMTDGILLQEIARDPELRGYDILIVDEVHERTLNIDFLIGYLRQLLPRRTDLKVILMSATIEAERFQRFFHEAAIVEIPGATHPVDVRYRPTGNELEGGGGLYDGIVSALQELDEEARGDVLVFLPGEREINEAAEVIRGAQLPGTEVLPLYARLAITEQQRVFQPHAQRHIVLSTNVAETSVTVPGVRHVIDSGLARIASYSARSKLQRLPVSRISQASADQRKGRCGRERAGICIRLYSEAQLLRSPRYTEPELQRSNLAGVILRLADLGLGRLEDFPLLDPPRHTAISDGYQLLRELGALDAERRLQPLGRRLARLPLDPRLARMVLAARDYGCLAEVLVMVSALSAGDPRERPDDARQAADLAHAAFIDYRSDFMWFVNAWQALQREMLPLSRRQQQAWCRAHYWSWRRVREWMDIHAELVSRLKPKPQAEPASYRAIHQALLTGLLTRIARWENKSEYIGCRQQRMRLHPSSGVRGKPPKWIVAGEIVETTLTYARQVAKIDPKWVSQVGGGLIKRSYSPPIWDQTRGEAYVLEEQALHGLILASGRRVPLQTLDPVEAHEVLIRHGLLKGELGASPSFLDRNLALVARVLAAEARARRRDLLAEESSLLDFYRTRIPAEVATRRQLLAWLREDPERESALVMSEAVVTRAGIDHITTYLFPDALEMHGRRFPLRYKYAPGEEDDGITVEIPLAVLAQIPPPPLDRLVPGLLTEKISHLIRRLPKERRRFLSPVGEFAPALTAAIEGLPGSLIEALQLAVQRITGVTILRDEWNLQDLPPHLCMRVTLLDEQQAELASTRDLTCYLESQRGRLTDAFVALPWQLPEGSARQWDFGELPEEIIHRVGGVSIHGYPALNDLGDAVSVQVFSLAEEAAAAHRKGVLRLLQHALPGECKRLRKEISALSLLELQALRAGLKIGLGEELFQASFEAALGASVLPRSPEAFTRTCDSVARTLFPALREQTAVLEALLPRVVSLATEKLSGIEARWPEVATEVRQQLGAMFDAGFLFRDPGILAHYPRYLEALRIRLARLEENPGWDRQQRATLAEVEGQVAASAAGLPRAVRERLAFLLHELRVALFAPTLKTAEKVSPQRIGAFLASALEVR